ncbi:MAG: hypothetical protein AB8B78_14545 [Polaribacter sp.]
MKKYLFFLITIIGLQSFSQTNNLNDINDIDGKEIHSKLRLNYIPVDMPFDQFTPNLEKKMTMLGMHYFLPINKNFYGGVVMYGAIFGDQSGFFTIGATVGYQHKIFNNIYLDANFHIGAGGSNSQLVNTGLLLNPNIGFEYKFKKYSFGLQYSLIDFPTGIINSNSWSVFLEIPSVLKITDYKEVHKKFIANNIDKSSFWQKPAVKSVQQIRFDFLFPVGKSKKDDGKDLSETLYMLGFEYQKYLNKNTFAYVHTDAIYRGLTAGYMDLFFGLGYNWIDTSYLNFFTKFGIGAAGGRVAQEGGLTAYPSTGFDLKITERIALSGHAGYFRFLDGTLEAYTGGLGIKYFNFSGGVKNKYGKNNFKIAETKSIQIAIENQWYWNMKRRDGSSVDLDQIAIRVLFDVSKKLYLLGETSFAYGGADAGGYAHGIVGLGYNSKAICNNKIIPFIELGVGVAGGGRIDTKGGVVVRPAVGLNYNIKDNLKIKGSYAQFYSPFGTVNSPNFNIGVVYGLSFLNVKK